MRRAALTMMVLMSLVFSIAACNCSGQGSETDSDGDGLPDGWELEYNLDPYDPSDANMDSDGDMLTNLVGLAQEARQAPPPLSPILETEEEARLRQDENKWHFFGFMIVAALVLGLTGAIGIFLFFVV